MDQFDKISDVLMYFIPALLVLLAMFWLVKKNMERDYHIRMLELKKNLDKETIQFKLQAYERFVLFLERISPNSVLPRLHRSGMTAGQLHSELLVTIRTEFEHNYSQQLYISQVAWEEVKTSKEEMVRLINNSFKAVGERASAMQLSTHIFEELVRSGEFPTQKAIDYLKREAKNLIG